MRFLIVDDSSTRHRIIINTLTKLGCETFLEASNGREGLDRLGAGQIELVITAWNMPELNGIDFVRPRKCSRGSTIATPRSRGREHQD